jgi:hypothetical protein
VAEAEERKEKVLQELAERRRAAEAQLDKLKAERGRLLDAFQEAVRASAEGDTESLAEALSDVNEVAEHVEDLDEDGDEETAVTDLTDAADAAVATDDEPPAPRPATRPPSGGKRPAGSKRDGRSVEVGAHEGDR